MLLLLPQHLSAWLHLPSSHWIFYNSSWASVSPGSPLMGWIAPAAPLHCHPVPRWSAPGSPVGCGLLEGRDHAWTPSLSPALSLAYSGTQEMSLNQTKHRRNDLCLLVPQCTDNVISSEMHIPNSTLKNKIGATKGTLARKWKHGAPRLWFGPEKPHIYAVFHGSQSAVTRDKSANPVITATFAKW